jgi:hypothetical protein
MQEWDLGRLKHEVSFEDTLCPALEIQLVDIPLEVLINVILLDQVLISLQISFGVIPDLKLVPLRRYLVEDNEPIILLPLSQFHESCPTLDQIANVLESRGVVIKVNNLIAKQSLVGVEGLL